MKRQEMGQQENQNYLRELTFIMFDRSRLILRVFLSVFLVGLLAAIFLPPTYRASAKFSVSIPQQMDPLQKEMSYDYKNRLIRLLQDQKELIYSNRVLQKVVDSQFADTSPKDLPKLLDKLREDIVVAPPSGETVEGSSVFFLSYRGKDPFIVANVARAVADAYMNSYSEVSKLKTDYSHEFFKGQVESLLAVMKEKETALRKYETEKAEILVEMLNLEANKTSLEVGLNSRLMEAQRKQNEYNEQLIVALKLIEAVETELKGSAIPAILPEMEAGGRAVAIFKNKVAQLQIQINEMKSQYEPGFVPLRQAEEELRSNIVSLREELTRALRAQKISAASIKLRIQKQEEDIAQFRKRIQTIAEEKSVYEHLKQEFSLARDAYTSVRAQLEQARMANAVSLEKQNITLVDAPDIPNKPSRPNRPLLVALGFFGGIMIGVAVALLADSFDHSLKKIQDVERCLGLEVLGSVPKAG